jgi:hypothetical protein
MTDIITLYNEDHRFTTHLAGRTVPCGGLWQMAPCVAVWQDSSVVLLFILKREKCDTSKIGTVYSAKAMKALREVEVYLHSFLTSVLDGDKWSASRTDRFNPQKELSLCIVWASVPVWTFRCGDKCLAGTRVSGLPACNMVTIATELLWLHVTQVTCWLSVQCLSHTQKWARARCSYQRYSGRQSNSVKHGVRRSHGLMLRHHTKFLHVFPISAHVYLSFCYYPDSSRNELLPCEVRMSACRGHRNRCTYCHRWSCAGCKSIST